MSRQEPVQPDSVSIGRVLKVHLPLALSAGLIVGGVLYLSAWYNLRNERNVCRRQDWSRSNLRFTAESLEWYHRKTGEYPQTLNDYEKYRKAKEAENEEEYVPGIATEDDWGKPFEYTLNENGFTLKSLGRDGKPGGIGLDADLYHDDRNHDETLATFEQFYTESDRAEVDRGSFLFGAIFAGGFVVFVMLKASVVEELAGKKVSVLESVVVYVVVIVLAVAIGIFLMPLHIPSGH